MNAGAVEQVGPPATLVVAPQTQFVAKFVGRRNEITCYLKDGCLYQSETNKLVASNVALATVSESNEYKVYFAPDAVVGSGGIEEEEAIGLIVKGYAKDVLNKLPMEFAVEAQKLLTISLEGSVG